MVETLMASRRKELGLTLSDVASRSGLARSYLYQIERGESIPTLEAAKKLAKGLETTVAELAGEPSTKEGRDALIALRNLSNAVNGLDWNGDDFQKANLATALANAHLVLGLSLRNWS
jgi:transcriptional regulator with XRE-family HTH domain